MTITIETTGIQEMEQILHLLQTLNIRNIQVQPDATKPQPNITKGNKKINPKALFGIWEEEPRTIEEIRSTNWQRNWNI